MPLALLISTCLFAADLRVVIHGRPDDLPRDDSPKLEDLSNADAIAARLSVSLSVHYVSERRELEALLQSGEADVAITPSLQGAMRARGLKETLPVRAGEVVLVVRRGATNAPKTKSEITRVRVASSRFDGVLKALSLELGRPIATEPVQALDELDAIARVGSGDVESCVALGEDVQAYRAFRDDVDVGLVLAKVPLTWAVRDDATLKRVNEYFSERSLTQHRRAAEQGDLQDVKRRKALRVAMLNNSASYFVHRGEEVGFQFELARVLAERLGVRLEIVVPDKPSTITELLKKGRADLAVASTQTDADVAYSQPYMFANQVLVQKEGQPPITDFAALKGRTITVRKSSAYWPVLEAAKAKGGFLLAAADETLETEDLIDQVGKGTVALTVANSSLFELEQRMRDEGAGVQSSLVFAEAKPLVYAARKSSPALLAEVNAFIKESYRGRIYNTLYNKYFRDERRITRLDQASASGISPYDDVAKKYAAQYGLDWRFVVAQMYAESRFDPAAKSWVGAVGLMQVMPRTAASLGFAKLTQPEDQVHAGVRYMADLLKRIDPAMELRQRLRFALAAYNAGLGHVLDARELARQRGLDQSRWFDNVEQTILLLEKKEFADRARHGYCRGRDVVRYVSQIQSKYDAYVVLQP
ncbi:MAG: transporter substrate-binding domain-containing protein [Deltaproteobacteria bacterium]|nr:transporter substrate-binding domain-containing protein [Deltaproteobacteria bacterium]